MTPARYLLHEALLRAWELGKHVGVWSPHPSAGKGVTVLLAAATVAAHVLMVDVAACVWGAGSPVPGHPSGGIHAPDRHSTGSAGVQPIHSQLARAVYVPPLLCACYNASEAPPWSVGWWIDW